VAVVRSSVDVCDYQLTYGAYGRPLFRLCEAVDLIPRVGRVQGLWHRQCGAPAFYHISWPGYYYNGRHSMLVCSVHLAAQFRERKR
jgi:hypothetical protein